MKRLFLAVAVMAALLIPAASASAAPKGEFVNFAQCPLSNPALEQCFYSATVEGEVTTGAKTVPIKNKQVLQGGLDFVIPGEIFGPINFLAAANGDTFSKTPQAVPGGLLGVTAPTWWPKFLQDLFNDTINDGFTGVTATTELAGPVSSIKLSLANAFLGAGPALELPVKIKLGNPFLGSSCYIGSNSSPITWKLTTGTTAPPAPNKPITGSLGIPELNPESTLLRFKGTKLVDNAFATPGANGCGGLFSFLIDPFVNSIVGIPSPAGKNTAILVNNLEQAVPEAVKNSEK